MKKAIMLFSVVIVLSVIFLIQMNVSEGTFTNDKIKDKFVNIQGYTQYKDLDNDIAFLYPEYCEIVINESDDIVIQNYPDKSDIYEMVSIDVNTNSRLKSTYNFDVFGNIQFFVFKILSKDKEALELRSDVLNSFSRLEDINGKKLLFTTRKLS